MIPFQQNWHDTSPVLQGPSELRASNIPDVQQENHSCITATFVTRMAARSGQFFILESPSSLGASWSRTWLNMAFVIKTMRLLGWLQGSLKSESSICSNGLCWPTHSGGLRSLMCNYATKITTLPHWAYLLWAQPYSICSAPGCWNHLLCEGPLLKGILCLCGWYG